MEYGQESFWSEGTSSIWRELIYQQQKWGEWKLHESGAVIYAVQKWEKIPTSAETFKAPRRNFISPRNLTSIIPSYTWRKAIKRNGQSLNVLTPYQVPSSIGPTFHQKLTPKGREYRAYTEPGITEAGISDVPARLWPVSPGFGPQALGFGLEKLRPGPAKTAPAWPGLALA
ncbi:hypothetical protein BDP27DRAFT_1507786 [Rhodocollybia butyracea]|uniref:Uncharacterized protein n=1 Tax=Rhodocollybia butyracea TaxID=206335 RepID=A0A9P5P448_9AGAR|nr:hypothetical protein BDP27DRAFT_1507786 [Rhodocollybia butyracea]